MENKISRFKAREQGFFLIFEKLFHPEPIEEIIENACESRELEFDDYAVSLVNGVEEHKYEIDGEISAHLKKGWSLNRISKTSLAVMRLAVYEMKYEDSVPDSVAINEAVELAKKYCYDDSRFINGVLGAVSRE
ncbi:MAG: transcription antitermination factor NusB [Ruminococcus sp.]|nr:transcription antitermination factor NusB [Ruminococcus sp.]